MLLETRYARRGDIHVAYQVLGEGETDLVLVSEWFSHLEARWEIPSFERFLRRLSSFSRLISFDKYGIGLSDPAPPGSLPPLEEWMDDVRTVMDAAHSERAAIPGWRTHGRDVRGNLSRPNELAHPGELGGVLLVGAGLPDRTSCRTAGDAHGSWSRPGGPASS